jgi:hypothetical protein
LETSGGGELTKNNVPIRHNSRLVVCKWEFNIIMKKLFLFLAVIMTTFSSYATTIVHFTSSCGRACTYTTETKVGSALTQELKEVNEQMCGTSNVTIHYY